MKQLLDAVTDPGAIVGSRPNLTPLRSDQDGELVAVAQGNGGTIWLTRAELGAVGYREGPGQDGQRVGQFGLCRDASGEWVYAPLKRANETLEQMLERNAEGRQRMKVFCPSRKGSPGDEREWRA